MTIGDKDGGGENTSPCSPLFLKGGRRRMGELGKAVYTMPSSATSAADVLDS